jgi:hypothetical protein
MAKLLIFCPNHFDSVPLGLLGQVLPRFPEMPAMLPDQAGYSSYLV